MSDPSDFTSLTLLGQQMAVPPGGMVSQLQQLHHRTSLLHTWQKGGAVFSASRVIDIGCGQGDQTVALLGLQSVDHVVGADPGQPNYGSPYTLSQAHAKLLSSPLFHGRLSFQQGDAGRVLSMYPIGHFQTAVLSHSLWYFPSESAVRATFVALKQAKVGRIAAAEWSWTASRPEAVPHLLAVLAQSLKVDSESNIRLPLSPKRIKSIAADAGWTVAHEEHLSSPELQDGVWEVSSALAMKKSASGDVNAERHLDALEASLSPLDSHSKVQSMDVWAAVFE